MLPIPPPRESGFTTTTEVPLYWCAYGTPAAERVLVLHGGPGASHDYLLPQMLRLAKGRELAFYDQRGGGRSRVDADVPVTWPAHVEDLARVALELRVDPLVVVGYSWGGLLALLHAVEAAAGRSPVVPGAILLIDPGPVSRAHRVAFEAEFARRQASPEIGRLREELAASGLRERDPEAYRERAFELSVAGYFADPTAARDLTPFRVVGRVQQAVWEGLGEYDLAPALSSVRCRALVVHGREDPIPLGSSEACARALGAPLVVLDRCGHVPYVEQPDALFEVAEAFLGHH
ncbi:MAG: alpha/beta fold hydrolase [Gemmatimonadota bacterium]|nr:alpha/beta fold hydrolase [Gemmatimonadota bacterium]